MDCSQQLAAAVHDAFRTNTLLRIAGSGSKAFHTGLTAGTPLDLRSHRGIIDYAPSELVLTARAGTPLAEIEALLAQHGQMLAFEPPYFGADATLGGTVACGFSGPRRPYAGALRDFVLGARVVNGKGEVLKFGGQVMKNVAGFDVSRLMAGAFGTLGVLLEVSLKVLPRPKKETTLRLQCPQPQAIELCSDWAGKPLPISATAWLDECLHIRLAGSAVAVDMARQTLGGELSEEDDTFWPAVREHTLPFFHLEQGDSLWRLAVPPATPPLTLAGRTCLDWGGAQRWLVTPLPDAAVFAAVRNVGGHATRFRCSGASLASRIALDPATAALTRRIKQAFDPAGILNSGVLGEIG